MQAVPAHAVAVAEHRPLRAWIDTSALVVRGVLVRQDVAGGKTRLVGYTVDGRRLTLLPGIQLRGVLRLQVDGIHDPVTLCALRPGADSLPCLSASDVGVDTAHARLDADGTLRFNDQLSSAREVLPSTYRVLSSVIRIGARHEHASDSPTRHRRSLAVAVPP